MYIYIYVYTYVITYNLYTACSLTPEMRAMDDTSTVYRLNILPKGKPTLCRQGMMNAKIAPSHWIVNSAAANTPVHECIEYR